MRIIQPIGRSEPSETAVPTVRRFKGQKPQWLKDWIEDQGSYVLLSCGHKTNMNDRASIIIARIAGVYLVCERCNDLAAVVRHMKFTEYAEIPPKAESKIPLF